MGNYVFVTTSDSDQNGRPKDAGMINGGFYSRNESSGQHPSVVIAVEDLKKSMKNIKSAGGKVLGESMKIPGYGMYISFIDTENNRVSLMEPFMDMMDKK